MIGEHALEVANPPGQPVPFGVAMAVDSQLDARVRTGYENPRMELTSIYIDGIRIKNFWKVVEPWSRI